MKFLMQIKLPRTEETAWIGDGLMLKTTHNGIHLLHGEEISNAQHNLILDTYEQNGYTLIYLPA